MKNIKHGAVLVAVTMYLKKTHGGSLLCVFLCGSRANDHADERSDFDFVAITDGTFSQRSRKTVQGCELDFFVLPYQRLKLDLASTGRPHIVRMLASARPVYDVADLSTSIIRRAQVVLENGVRARAPFQLWARAADAYHDAAAVYRTDPFTAAILCSDFVRTSFELFFVSRGVWTTSTKHMFQEVERLDREAASLGRSILTDGAPWEERLRVMRSLYQRCAERSVDEPANYLGPRTVHLDSERPRTVVARRIDYAV